MNTALLANEDRSQLLKDAVSISLLAAHGLEKLNEQNLSQVLGNLVRSKLLSADDSYRLKDQLMNSEVFENALNNRIESALKRKGIVTENMMNNLHQRLATLEQTR